MRLSAEDKARIRMGFPLFTLLWEGVIGIYAGSAELVGVLSGNPLPASALPGLLLMVGVVAPMFGAVLTFFLVEMGRVPD